MVLDTSALVAIFRKEPDWKSYLAALRSARQPRLSAANLVECLIVLGSRVGGDGRERLLRMLQRVGTVVEPVTQARALLAVQAHDRFGKRNHAANLNYGDCFAYALAKELDLPLLFKGNDFPQTDIRPAL